MKRTIFLTVIIFILASMTYGQGMENLSKTKSSDLGLKRVGLRLGLAIPSSVYDPTYAASANIDFGEIIPQLGLSAEIDFWRGGVPFDNNDSYKKYNLTVGGGITASWRPQFDMTITPYAGAGIGAYYYKETYPENYVEGQPPADFNPFELHIELGGDYPLNEDYSINAAFRMNFSNISTYYILVGVRKNLVK